MPAKGSSSRVPVTCKTCGISFEIIPSYVQRGITHCSYTCRGIAQRKRVGTARDTCGVKFVLRPNEHKSRNYCSLACAHIGHRATKDEWIKPLNDAQRAGLKLGQAYFRGKSAKDYPSLARKIEASAAARRGKPNPKQATRMRQYHADHPEKHPNRILAQNGHETSIERVPRIALTAAGIRFESQYRIAAYWVDFAIASHRLAIEADGAYWHNAERDAARDAVITALGWTVPRFSEDRITANAEACVAEIRRRMA